MQLNCYLYEEIILQVSALWPFEILQLIEMVCMKANSIKKGISYLRDQTLDRTVMRWQFDMLEANSAFFIDEGGTDLEIGGSTWYVSLDST